LLYKSFLSVHNGFIIVYIAYYQTL